jgi:solute carrier family 26 (sodium-independent sulfate anion transporter), member 11
LKPGSLIYVFVGTVKEVSIGPTSLMALLTIQYTYGKPVEFVIILGFLSGCVELLMGLFKLGSCFQSDFRKIFF